MPATIDSIRKDLERCQMAKQKPKIFGADSHQFKLNPVVRKSVLKNFETKHCVVLPDDYRRFLTEIGNGGAGPYYGVFKFHEMDDGFAFQRWKENNGFVGMIGKPFPHTSAWNDCQPFPEEDDFENEDLYVAEVERIDNVYWNTDNVNGAIPICHQGCAIRNWLVISGPEAGNVWEDLRADEGGLQPTKLKRKKRLTFLEWYDNWLQQAVAKIPKRNADKTNR